MEKDCCDIKVKEVENGYHIEITGEDVKEKCKTFLEKHCSEKNIKECFHHCCDTKE